MGQRLLIIDDDHDVIEVISEILKDLFDAIEGVHSVEEAEEILVENTYDLIFLDINLGKRNGAEVVKFLITSENNPNKTVPFIILSGIITPQFVDRYQKRFAGILMKPFEHDDLRELTEIVLGLKVIPVAKPLESASLDEIPYLKCELPFPLTQLDQRVNKILDQVRKSAKLKQLFNQMKIDRNADTYLLTHIGMLINISTAICIHMEWNTDKTLEKFVYAAYLHDMALSNRPDLARINTFAALENAKDILTPEEYKLIFEHPNIAANSVEGMNEIPPDVDVIIRQHHELPRGTGYPSKFGHQKLSPLSVVFIVAHDLTEYILENPKWKIADYIASSKDRMQGSHFFKIHRVLTEIK